VIATYLTAPCLITAAYLPTALFLFLPSYPLSPCAQLASTTRRLLNERFNYDDTNTSIQYSTHYPASSASP
jgi:hypothetical protein